MAAEKAVCSLGRQLPRNGATCAESGRLGPGRTARVLQPGTVRSRWCRTGSAPRAGTGGLAWGAADHLMGIWPRCRHVLRQHVPAHRRLLQLHLPEQRGALESAPSWISAIRKALHRRGMGRPERGTRIRISSPRRRQGCSRAGLLRRQRTPAITAGWNSAAECWAIDAAIADFDLDRTSTWPTANRGTPAIPTGPPTSFSIPARPHSHPVLAVGPSTGITNTWTGAT